ncbi:energy transducer TonB [Granulicella sp. WH15]|uniref:energy transducer TonB n=1 Tax=Granulicella sp. WH15 TaxID=2602070 RepID=UPI0013A5BBCB|nr:energy transducer TonB [Granulicella sp. WH15]
MRLETPASQRRTPSWGDPRWLVLSGTLHLLLIVVLVHSHGPRVAATDHPGDRFGHHILLTYSAGHAPAAEKAPIPHKQPPPPPAHAALSTPKPPPPAPAASSSTTAASTESGTSSDALGNGNVTVALVILHPPPQPDLSRLPSGTRGDVIVDVVIDASGRIVKTTMASGLGHGVDETVLATIQQWTFQPATRNGVPVPSEQELLFHYERG